MGSPPTHPNSLGAKPKAEQRGREQFEKGQTPFRLELAGVETRINESLNRFMDLAGDVRESLRDDMREVNTELQEVQGNHEAFRRRVRTLGSTTSTSSSNR